MKTHAIKETLLELEQQYWQAIKDKDVDAAMRLTDDPCIVAGAQGVGRIDAKAMASRLKAAPYTLDDFEVKDAQVHLLSDDVAVVAYRVHEDLTVEGEPVKLDAADASTWIRRNGDWVCALHTEAIAGEPFGRDRRPLFSNPDDAAAFEDEREIRRFFEAWMIAARTGDVDTALDMMADDVVFMVPGAEPFGRREFETRARQLKNVSMNAEYDIEELVVLGDWAYCRTNLTVTMTPPDGPKKRRSGRTLTLFRKQDGAWVLARDANLMMQAG